MIAKGHAAEYMIYKNTFTIKVFFLKYRNGISDKIMGHK